MKLVYPGYYEEFKCIAGRCRHTCCIGWEIDIDEGSLCRYEKLDGEFGQKVRCSISYEGSPHFLLKKGDRCPFLNEDNLCDMILNLGEESLCEICTYHPRFRNFFSDCEEIGLGLCCEAAAELIIKDNESFYLCNFDLSDDSYTDEERELLFLREELFGIIKEEAFPIEERFERLFSRVSVTLPDKALSEWCDVFLSLERLDDSWTDVLIKLKSAQNIEITASDKEQENLATYFLYRYIATAKSFSDIQKCSFFAVLSVKMICAAGAVLGDICEAARMYSGEVEYSEENLFEIMEKGRGF